MQNLGVFCRGVIIRELARRHSNYRAEQGLNEFLSAHGLAGIAGIDTRRLTRLLREQGAIPGAFGSLSESELLSQAQQEPGTDGVDLVSAVTTAQPYTVGSGERRIVALDFGIKSTILDHLGSLAPLKLYRQQLRLLKFLLASLTGSSCQMAQVTDMLDSIAREISQMVGVVPMFGICLGHQLLGKAVGATTIKLPFGHHGGIIR